MEKRKCLLLLVILLSACGLRKKEAASQQNLQVQLESRMVELACECIGTSNNGQLDKKEYEALRDSCLGASFPQVSKEYGVSQDNIPYSGIMEVKAAFNRIKEGVNSNCPMKED